MHGEFALYYEALELGPDASQRDIELAYVRLSNLLAADNLASYGMLDEAMQQQQQQRLDQAYRALLHGRIEHQVDDKAPVMAQQAHDAASLASDQAPESALAVAARAARAVAESVEPPTFAQKLETSAASSRMPPRLFLKRPPVRVMVAVAAENLPDDTSFDGAMLRSLRQSAQASLDDVSNVTKISRRYLSALENDDFALLPAAVYVRGFVAEYARALSVPPNKILPSYMGRYLAWRDKQPWS